jgi:hypothetical protein
MAENQNLQEETTTEGSKYDAFMLAQIQPLGLKDDKDTLNYLRTYNPEAEHPVQPWGQKKVFQRDREGNLQINYWRVDGEEIYYYNEELKNPKPIAYCTIRLKDPLGNMKYKMPSGQGALPWFHPNTVEAFREGTKIETIYLTEGVKKAFMAGLEGVHVVGLASITCYAGADKQLHRDIIRLIENCQVDNVVILWDGDCLDVSRKGIQVREEATRRPFGFFNSAKQIRRLITKATWDKPRACPRIFFQHVNSETFHDSLPKGLDDMLIAAKAKDKTKAVIAAMNPLTDKGGYFYNIEITSTTDLLYKYFRLDDAERFYQLHSHIIGEQEFYFQKNMYHYSDIANKLILLQPEWAKHISWIGDEFFEEISIPSAHKTITQRTLVHRKKETLSARHGRDFIKYLKYYHAFVNVPTHFGYERIIERDGKEYFNQYFPFPHVREEGKCENILMFLRHIFGTNKVTHPVTGQEIPNYELGIDYLQLLLTNPTQQLPIIVLYSAENQTGKSTFGELIYNMFGDNASFIGNKDLQSDFNEIFAGRLVAICEETQIERRQDAERIKNMSTASRITINPKGQKQYTIDFFTKFVFFSNHRRMVYVTRHDDRYWILQVPPLQYKDPGLKERMWAEIPAFVNLLSNREMATKTEARMHFLPQLLKTPIFMDTVRVNEPAAATDLRIKIADMFLDDQDLQVIEMPLANIIEEFLPKTTSRIWAIEMLKDYLNVEQLKDAAGKLINKRGEYSVMRYNEYGDNGEGEVVMKNVKWRGRPYVFNRNQFVEDEARYTELDWTTAAEPAKEPVTADEEPPF